MRRYWGRIPVLRVFVAFTIWLLRYRLGWMADPDVARLA